MDKLKFWNDRAQLGFKAGTNDEIMKKMEMKAISSYIKDDIMVLDFGCGNGITMVFLVKMFNIKITGIDFSSDMIAEAKKLSQKEKVDDRIDFIVGDENILKKINRKFDIIYSERALINLDSWEKQKSTIINLCKLLSERGKYIMCESSLEGLKKINMLRKFLNLEEIIPPWHNKYFTDSEIDELKNSEMIELVETNYFSSTYYFLSRVINAGLAMEYNQEPSYNSPINELALRLPPIGKFGQGKIWVWKNK